jgi:hypothetical protein
MIHEFEALLFSGAPEICRALYQPKALTKIEAICDAFENPEYINDNPKTAPSKRIKAIFPGYQKTLHGPMISSRIGLENIRRECPHFDEWVSWLEDL